MRWSGAASPRISTRARLRRKRPCARSKARGAERAVLDRLEQNVPLSSERKLYHAFGREVPQAEHHLVVGHGLVVDPQSARLDLTGRLAVGGAGAALPRKRVEHADALLQLGARHLDGRQAGGERAFLEGLARGRGRGLGGRAAVQERGRLGGEDLLRLVDLAALERREAGDLVQRQVGGAPEQFVPL